MSEKIKHQELDISHWLSFENIFSNIVPAIRDYRDSVYVASYDRYYYDLRSRSLEEQPLCNVWTARRDLIPEGFGIECRDVGVDQDVIKEPVIPVSSHAYLTDGQRVLCASYAQGLWPDENRIPGERVGYFQKLAPELIKVFVGPNGDEQFSVLFGLKQEIKTKLGLVYGVYLEKDGSF